MTDWPALYNKLSSCPDVERWGGDDCENHGGTVSQAGWLAGAASWEPHSLHLFLAATYSSHAGIEAGPKVGRGRGVDDSAERAMGADAACGRVYVVQRGRGRANAWRGRFP